MNKIQQTSITAYHQEKQRNLSKKQQIYNIIKNQNLLGITDHQIMIWTGWPRNIVSARRRELVQENKIIQDGTVYDGETKKDVCLWRVKP